MIVNGKVMRCKLCNAGPFTYNWEVAQHVRLNHHKHECKECGKDFDTERGLTNHTNRMHNRTNQTNRESGVSCPHCDFHTNNNGNLKRHITAKHGKIARVNLSEVTQVNVQTCPCCSAQFVVLPAGSNVEIIKQALNMAVTHG